MKDVNEELEGNTCIWDENQGRWIEPDEVPDEPILPVPVLAEPRCNDLLKTVESTSGEARESNEIKPAKAGNSRDGQNFYPEDWPKCPACGAPALDGHITCGLAGCDEGGHRDLGGNYTPDRIQANLERYKDGPEHD